MPSVVARSIVFAPGAEENEVAAWAHRILRARTFSNVPDHEAWRKRELSLVRATIGLVAKDLRITATLRFDRGTVVIHDGAVGIPDVTVFGTFENLASLAELPLSRVLHLPRSLAWTGLAGQLAAGELKIFGLATHPRLVFRLLKLFAQD